MYWNLLQVSQNAQKLEIRDIIIGVPTTIVNMLISCFLSFSKQEESAFIWKLNLVFFSLVSAGFSNV